LKTPQRDYQDYVDVVWDVPLDLAGGFATRDMSILVVTNVSRFNRNAHR
jgi:hypothetical protein